MDSSRGYTNSITHVCTHLGKTLMEAEITYINTHAEHAFCKTSTFLKQLHTHLQSRTGTHLGRNGIKARQEVDGSVGWYLHEGELLLQVGERLKGGLLL